MALSPATPGTPPAAAAETAVSRRTLLERFTAFVAVACGLGTGVAALKASVPTTRDAETRRLHVGRAADFKMNTTTWLADAELFIVRTRDGLAALSTRCTHLGCTVRRTREGFSCPCHGAVFDAEGHVVSGPARRTLPWFAMTVTAAGECWVNAETEVNPGTYIAPAVSTRETP